MAGHLSTHAGYLLCLLLCTFAIATVGFQPNSFIPTRSHGPLLHRSFPEGRSQLLAVTRPRISLRSSTKSFTMVASAPRPTGTEPQQKPKLTSKDLPDLYDDIGKLDMAKLYQGKLQNIHGLWDVMASVCPEHLALVDHIHEGGTQREITFQDARDRIEVLAGALQRLGVAKGDKLAMFAENSYRWALLDAAILKTGAANVVRGAGAPLEELKFIYKDSEASAAVFETTALLRSIAQSTDLFRGPNRPRFVVVMFSKGMSAQQVRELCGLADSEVEVVRMADMMAWQAPFTPVEVGRDDVATLLYTSGTTGKPKGVVISHGNMLHQVFHNTFTQVSPDEPLPGDTQLCILPCWHIFERMAEYYALARGSRLVYSSIRTFKKDLTKWRPHIIVAVPRLYENLYDGVMGKFAAGSVAQRAVVGAVRRVGRRLVEGRRRLENREAVAPGEAEERQRRGRGALRRAGEWLVVAALGPLGAVGDALVWRKVREGLGGRVKCLVSGGSKLPTYLDDFYELAGLNIIVGYGLTETSPVIANRVIENNVPGSVGQPPAETEISIRDVETGEELARAGGRLSYPHSSGEVGVVWARGPQVTRGYYKRAEANAAAFDAEGFFNTGDLGRFCRVTGALFLTGRAKDTIVLLNGENVEPTPIEEALIASPLIDQVMLVGQDEKQLAALVVLNPVALADRALLPAPRAQALRAQIPATPRDPTPDPAALALEAAALNADAPLRAAVLREVKAAVRGNPQFQPWEQVGAVHLLLEPFTMDNGLMTQTLKVKRDAVAKRYEAEIQALFSA